MSPANDAASKIRVEFAVNISNRNDLKRIEEALKLKGGVNLVSSDLQEKMIQLDLQVNYHQPNDASLLRASEPVENVQSLQRFIEQQTGFLAVIKGLGELSSAVAELRPAQGLDEANQVIGVVRLSQLEQSKCYADGSLDGSLFAGGRRSHYSLAIHEFGDLAGEGYKNIGRPVKPIQESQIDGEFHDRRLVVSRLLDDCDVASMIGKSIALTSSDMGLSIGTNDGRQQVLSAGVIARASTIGANKKQICSCSGKTLWEERLDSKQRDASGNN